MMQIRRCLIDGFCQNAVKKKQIPNTLGVAQYSLLILRVVKVEGWLLLWNRTNDVVITIVAIKARKMSTYTSMQTTDNSIEGLLLSAHLFTGRGLKTVITIYQLPNIRSVVVGERLYVGKNVKVLSLVVRLIFNVPNPLLPFFSSFISP